MLALALSKHHDAIYADFQQYYGVDLWTLDIFRDEYTVDVKRASILAAQLPREARLHVEIDPRARISLEDELLRRIEFNQRLWHYSNTEDAKKKINEPSPLPFPGEEEAREKAAEKAANTSKYVAEQFGLIGLAVK